MSSILSRLKQISQASQEAADVSSNSNDAIFVDNKSPKESAWLISEHTSPSKKTNKGDIKFHSATLKKVPLAQLVWAPYLCKKVFILCKIMLYNYLCICNVSLGCQTLYLRQNM